MTEWQVLERFKCSAECGEAEQRTQGRTAGEAQRVRQRHQMCESVNAVGPWPTLLADRMGAGNKEGRVLRERGWIEYRLTEGGVAAGDGLELSEHLRQ